MNRRKCGAGGKKEDDQVWRDKQLNINMAIREIANFQTNHKVADQSKTKVALYYVESRVMVVDGGWWAYIV